MNARVLAERGGAVLLLEKDCTPEALYEQITALLADKERIDRMSTALRSWVVVDSTDRICEIMERLVKNKASDNADR